MLWRRRAIAAARRGLPTVSICDDQLVAIEIARIGDRYGATVSPPHGRGIEWTSPEPLTADELVAELLGRGCQQTDIGDAFYDADPDWLDH